MQNEIDSQIRRDNRAKQEQAYVLKTLLFVTGIGLVLFIMDYARVHQW